MSREYLSLEDIVSTVPPGFAECYVEDVAAGVHRLRPEAREFITKAKGELDELERNVAGQHAAADERHERLTKAMDELIIARDLEQALINAGAAGPTLKGAVSLLRSTQVFTVHDGTARIRVGDSDLPLAGPIDTWLDSEGHPFSTRRIQQSSEFANKIRRLIGD